MRPMISRLLPLLLLLLAMTWGASSCVHRQFEYESGETIEVEVVFDWLNAPDADPATMSLYLFSRDGRPAGRYDFVGRDGGRIRVAPGVYDAICINSDRRDVVYSGADLFDTFEVTTPAEGGRSVMPGVRASDLPLAPGTEDQPIMMTPPVLWSSSETGFIVPELGASRAKTRDKVTRVVLTMYPRLIVDTYQVTVRNIRNARYLAALSGTISDMSAGYLAGERRRTDTAVILPFDLAADTVKARAQGRFLTFGHCPAARRVHKMMLYAILVDGSRYYWEFDVTDQAHNPPDEEGVYHIVVEFLDIPEPEGDFNPEVNDWNPQDIYITI